MKSNRIRLSAIWDFPSRSFSHPCGSYFLLHFVSSCALKIQKYDSSMSNCDCLFVKNANVLMSLHTVWNFRMRFFRIHHPKNELCTETLLTPYQGAAGLSKFTSYSKWLWIVKTPLTKNTENLIRFFFWKFWRRVHVIDTTWGHIYF